MGRRNPNSKPSFFWQALLIVLPVIVLAVVGFFSLRQDKILAQHEATERAQAIADDLLPRIWSELTSCTNPAASGGFHVDGAGELLFPPPFVAVPTPKRFDLAQLNSE